MGEAEATAGARDALRRISDAVDRCWGFHARAHRSASLSGWYRTLVDDAVQLTFTPCGAGEVRIDGAWVAPEPDELPTRTVPLARLDAALAELDAEIRDALPRDYLAACDAHAFWAEQSFGAPMHRPQAPLAPQRADDAPPGPSITLDDIPDLLERRYARRLTGVERTRSEVRASLDSRLTIAIVHDAARNAVSAAIVLGPDANVLRVFGTALIARHPDAASISELLDMIDHWILLRYGASELARRLLADPVLPLAIRRVRVLRPYRSRSDAVKEFSVGDIEVECWVRTRADGAWELYARHRTDTTLYLVTNDMPALIAGFAKLADGLQPHPRSRAFVYDPPHSVAVTEADDGSIMLDWGEGSWLHGVGMSFTATLTLAHLLDGTPQQLAASMRSPDGAPLLRSVDEHLADLAAHGFPRAAVITHHDAWRDWLTTRGEST